MNLLIEFADSGVLIDTVTQRTIRVRIEDKSKYSKPLYVVRASEVFSGNYFLLKAISKELVLAIDKKFKLVMLNKWETQGCISKYNYRLINDKTVAYTNSITSRNKFTCQLGHIEYMHGFDNSEQTETSPSYNGYQGELVSNNHIKGVVVARNNSAMLFTKFRGNRVAIRVDTEYNYRKLPLDFKYSTMLLGRYYRKFDMQKLNEDVLTKILHDNYYKTITDQRVQLVYNDLDTNIIDRPVSKSQLDTLRNLKEVYLYSKKHSNEKNIALYRVVNKYGIAYIVKGYEYNLSIKLEDMIEKSNNNLDNVIITDEYIEVDSLEGHYRYNIKEYYEYYKLDPAEKSLKYNMQKLINTDVIEDMRRNGELYKIKMDTDILEIPKGCKVIKYGSIQSSPKNRVVHIPDSVKTIEFCPFELDSRHVSAIEEVIIENNIDNFLYTILSDIYRHSKKLRKVTVNKMGLSDMYLILFSCRNIEVELTSKSKRLSSKKVDTFIDKIKYRVENIIGAKTSFYSKEEVDGVINNMEFISKLVDAKYEIEFSKMIDMLNNFKKE